MGGIVLKAKGSEYSEKNMSQCYFVHYKSHRDWPGIGTGIPRRDAGD